MKIWIPSSWPTSTPPRYIVMLDISFSFMGIWDGSLWTMTLPPFHDSSVADVSRNILDCSALVIYFLPHLHYGSTQQICSLSCDLLSAWSTFSFWAVFFDIGCHFQTLCHFRLSPFNRITRYECGWAVRDECFDIDFTFTGDVNHLWSVTSVTSDFVSKSSFRRTISDPEWIAFVTNSSSSVMRRRC